MFYDNYVRLCNARGEGPTVVARKVGVDKSAASRWSKGSIPRDTTLRKIADYFGVTVGELLGDGPINTENIVGVTARPEVDRTVGRKPENETIGNGLEVALEALRNQPGRRALLSATKNMTEAQVLRFADWLADVTGGNKD